MKCAGLLVHKVWGAPSSLCMKCGGIRFSTCEAKFSSSVKTRNSIYRTVHLCVLVVGVVVIAMRERVLPDKYLQIMHTTSPSVPPARSRLLRRHPLVHTHCGLHRALLPRMLLYTAYTCAHAKAN